MPQVRFELTQEIRASRCVGTFEERHETTRNFGFTQHTNAAPEPIPRGAVVLLERESLSTVGNSPLGFQIEGNHRDYWNCRAQDFWDSQPRQMD